LTIKDKTLRRMDETLRGWKKLLSQSNARVLQISGDRNLLSKTLNLA